MGAGGVTEAPAVDEQRRILIAQPAYLYGGEAAGPSLLLDSHAGQVANRVAERELVAAFHLFAVHGVDRLRGFEDGFRAEGGGNDHFGPLSGELERDVESLLGAVVIDRDRSAQLSAGGFGLQQVDLIDELGCEFINIEYIAGQFFKFAEMLLFLKFILLFKLCKFLMNLAYFMTPQTHTKHDLYSIKNNISDINLNLVKT